MGCHRALALRVGIVVVVVGAVVVVRPAGAVGVFDGSASDDAWIVLAGGEDIHVWEEGWPDLEPITDDLSESLYNAEPAWSPDGSKIVFATSYPVGYAEGEVTATRIEVMDADGRNRQTIVDLGVDGGDPAWSPDGSMIAYWSFVPVVPYSEIHVMNADGSGRRSIGVGEDPAWSPDGSQIAYTRWTPSGAVENDWQIDVWVMGADGSNPQNLTDSADTSDSEPSWSDDGRYLAYASAGAYSTIEVLDLESGGPPTAVTSAEHDDTHPVWAPDGRLAFSNTWEVGRGGRADGPGIYVTDRQGSEPELLLAVSGSEPLGAFDWGTHPGFADVGEAAPFAADIAWLAAEGITQGCNPPFSTRFCPGHAVSRGQMAALLVRALGYRDGGGGDLFVDDDGSIFEADIDRLAVAGVTKGCDPPVNDLFCPDDPVTRGQMAAFLRRALD